MASAGCPDRETLAALAAGRLSGEHLAAVAAHLDGCPACLALAQAARTDTDPLVAALCRPDPADPYAREAGCDRAVARLWSLAETGVGSELPTVIAPSPGPLPAAPDGVGRYRPVRLHARGGLGEVHVALDEELSRPVALKRIQRPRAADPESRRRFVQEAAITARLEHPGIVPVYGLVRDGSGQPCYAMRLIQGETLQEAITRFHAGERAGRDPGECRLALRDLLGRFVAVCNTVAYAHSRGVLHRDLKPANIMLGAYGETLVVDWGLAKTVGGGAEVPPAGAEAAVEAGDDHTRTGQALGTPAFMSPEQARGDRAALGPRSDVYSLGATLYCLVTGQPPFDREVADVLRKVQRGEFPAPRRLDPSLDAALEAVCLKAMATEPADRYESAKALAEDVERWLADEPVQACPPSVGYRLRKFARRNRRALTAALAFVLLLVTAVVALTVALVAANRERLDKEAALEAEGKHRRKVQAALDVMSSQIIEDWLSNQPALLPEHKQFLELALRYYEEFAEDTGQREESRAGVARAHNRVGNIREHLGQWKEAEAALERSRELYAGLAANFPGVPTYRMSLVQIHRHLGALYRRSGRVPKAEAALRQGVIIGRTLVAESPCEPDYQRGLGMTIDDLGIALKNLGRPREAEEAYREALGIHEKLVAQDPAEPGYRDSLAQAHLNLGNLLNTVDRRPEAAESLGKSVDIYVRLVAAFPTVPRYRDQLAISRNNLGIVLRDARRYPEAEAVFREALTTRKQLVAEFPTAPLYRRGLAMTLNNLGISLKNTDRVPEAEDLYGQSLDIHKKLAADFPTIPDHQNEAAAAMVNLARLLLAREDLLGARRLLEEGVPYHQAALKANPRHPDYRNGYRFNRWRMAETLLELDEHAAAAEAAGQFLQLAVEPPRDSYTAACLLAGCVRLAAQDESLTADRRQEVATAYGDRALAALRQAIDRGAKEAAQIPKDPSLDPLRSREDFQKLLADWEVRRKP
jgi:serine/threonine-protein kinase